MEIQYFCRSCKLPLVIDGSLQNLTRAQQNLLKLNYADNPRSDASTKEKAKYKEISNIPPERLQRFKHATKATQLSIKRTNTDSGLIENDDLAPDQNEIKSNQNSFVYVNDKDVQDEEEENLRSRIKDAQLNDLDNKKSNISERVDTLSTIFDIISARYEIDYPVCSDCASTLLIEIKNKFEALSKEKEVYMQFLKKLTIQNSPNVDKIKKALQDQDKLKEEQNRILEQLRIEDKKHLELIAEAETLEKEIELLEEEEHELCAKKNEKDSKLEEQLDELEAMKAQYTRNLDTLDNLRKIDPFGKIFSVSHEGQIGTINGLRLGCLEDVQITWPEINAALGQLLLMINTSLTILKITLQNYRLIPLGSRSRIELLSPRPKIINLYTSGKPLGSSLGGLLGNTLGGMFVSSPLSEELTHLENIVNQLASEARYTLPHSIPLQWDRWLGWEHWTRQLRLLLGNAHWVFSLATQERSRI